MEQKLTQKILKEYLKYNHNTGVFTWIKITSNRAKIGKIAGCDNGKGYIRIKLMNKYYVAHRLAWLYEYGELPSFEIDHKDRNKGNNAIGNLRKVTRTENNMNHPLRKDNTSGTTGVQWYEQYNKWMVNIRKNNKKYFLGYFENIEDAILARKTAEAKLGFDINHGKTI